MDFFSLSREFAEDLLLNLTRRLDVNWEPQRRDYTYRGQFPSKFCEQIGEVVHCFFVFQTRSPHELPDGCDNLSAVHDLISSRLLTKGEYFFNMLDYCGQLFYFALGFYISGDWSILDKCAIRIASTITSLLKNDEISEDYWYGLQETADSIWVPNLNPQPVYHTTLQRVNMVAEDGSYRMVNLVL